MTEPSPSLEQGRIQTDQAIGPGPCCRSFVSRFFRDGRIIFRREPWWAEFWSAVTALTWAGLSYTSVETLGERPSMRVLTEIGGDAFWHLTGCLLGLWQLTALAIDRRWLRWCAAVALCWFWGVLTLGVCAAVPLAPGIAVYAGWCGINLFSILRLLRAYPSCSAHERLGE